LASIDVSDEHGVPVRLRYDDHGDGRPVVFVHDWPLCACSWEAQLEPLVERGYRVIAYDRRGFGGSDKPWSGYDFDTLADDLHALLTGLDLTGAALVGAGSGGGEIVRYLSRHGDERVERVVFASTALPYLYRAVGNPLGTAGDDLVARIRAELRQDRHTYVSRHLTGYFNDTLSGPAMEYHRGRAARASARAVLEFFEAALHTDFRHDLAQVRVPSLVLHGERDLLLPRHQTADRVHEALPGSRYELIAGAPHGFFLTHARQANRILLDFLR
jgi:non-heme chloroperoxidase